MWPLLFPSVPLYSIVSRASTITILELFGAVLTKSVVAKRFSFILTSKVVAFKVVWAAVKGTLAERQASISLCNK